MSLGDLALGTSFVKKIRSWREVFKKDSTELKEIQKEKLRKMLSHASENSPFYKSFSIPLDQDPFKTLKNFPILPKQTLKERVDEFLTTDQTKGLTSITSSGSTGAPSKVYFNSEELSSNRALQIIWWEWAGYKFGNSVLQTGVNMKRSAEKKLKDYLLNTRYIDAVSHDENQIKEELELLLEHPRQHFVGYASSIFLFAKVANKYNIKGVKFDSIISIGEKLLPNFRKEIDTAFQSPIYDTYGASEGFLIASQCRKGTYHIMSPHLVLEILDEQGNEVKPGEMGRVVLTGLDNFTLPLIRYEIGDLAVKASDQTCSCGLQLPVLGEIVGRITEFIKTPRGKYITVQTVVRLMKKFEEIDQYKVIQHSESELEIELVSGIKLDSRYEEKISSEYERVLEEKLNIKFTQVPKISKAKTGKFQLIESRLN
ncbi:phenylacetate--CoA ligase family protein [Algoriphagus sediminis]|uniref:Phenylacetate--CoA ligase family protein n=1 Tax=Algoriphagus sediminis TaxID=3057113 RepID=A0ABT7YDY9_9BACT|nr:hypothetical protein [Algoriphagus sediminis]MDN3204736.1 hypothetical protein [Algoriphagus sediminis]